MKNYPAVWRKLESFTEFEYYCDFASENLYRDGGILAADWNDVPIGLVDALEDHYAIVWNDEYIPCVCCDRLIRIEPTHYGWLPQYCTFDGQTVCSECLRADIHTYIDHIVNCPQRADTLLSYKELLDLDFEELESKHEAGIRSHHQYEETPQKIFDRLQGNYGEILFKIDRKEQFGIRFSVWVRQYQNCD